MRSRFRAGLAVMAAAAIVATSSIPAVADNLVADGDDLTPVASNALSLGTVCVGKSVTKSALLAISRNGNTNNAFKAGADVTVSVTAVSGAGLAAVMDPSPATITLPASWADIGNNVMSPAVSSRVTLQAGNTAGTFSGSVAYSASGTEATGGSLTRNVTMPVTATISNTGSCAPTTNTAPNVSISGPEDGKTYEFGATPTATCSWSDDHDGTGTATPVVTGPIGPRATAGLGEVTVTCSQTDSGTPPLTGTMSLTYTVVDTTAPSIPPLSDVTAAAVDAAGAAVSYDLPVATDTVDGGVPLQCAPGSGSRFPLGSTAVTCTATDQEGNADSATFAVTVTDQDAPVVTVPDSMTLDATSPSGAVATFTASAEDNVDGAVEPVCTPASGSTFAFGSTIVTCDAEDAAGNTASGSFSVTVQDVTDPVLTVPSLEPVEATGPDGATVTWDAVTAKDDVDGQLQAVACDAQSGDVFALGDTTVTCTAEDSNGNTGRAAFVVTVRDTLGPGITVPNDFDVEATSSAGALVDFIDKVSASDLVDGSVEVDCAPASGEAFGFGPTLVTCTSEDSRGNTAEPASFTVTVVDTTPPALPSLADVEGVEATGSDGAIVNYTVGAANDIVDGDVPLDCTPSSGSTFALGLATVSCSATDKAGNTGRGSFAVKVVDTTAPVIGDVNVPTAEATSPQGAQVRFTVTATDLVDRAPSVECDAQSGDWFPLGSTTVHCTATDASGNKASAGFIVNVADTTAPVVESLSNATIEATSAEGAVYDYQPPTAFDTVDGAVAATCLPASGSTFPLGATTVTCSAEDHSGNKSSSGFMVTVKDTTAPTIGAVSSITVPATSSSGAIVTYTALTATDLVDGVVEVTCDHESGAVFGLGTTTVTCTATDAAGNQASKTFTVTVEVSWSGLLPPLDKASARTFKQGSTIPVRFALTGASEGITALDARLYVRRLGTQPPVDEVIATSTSRATSGNLFRYSASDKQYIFNLATKGLDAGTYELRVDLGDGVSRTVIITLR